MELNETEKKLEIPEGLFGFEMDTEFMLSESEFKPFLWLQSLTDRTLAFLVVDPFIFFPDYEIDVDDAALQKIDIASPADVLVLAVITAPGDGSPVTVNLQGPLIINRKNNKCMQVVLTDARWQTKHPIAPGQSGKRSATC